jgi:hypothetical protein
MNSPTLGTSSSYIASTLRKDFQVLFVNYVPNTLIGCTDVNPVELIELKGVTEPPKIISYYRLSRSTWPLSNNKELLSHFRRVKPG